MTKANDPSEAPIAAKDLAEILEAMARHDATLLEVVRTSNGTRTRMTIRRGHEVTTVVAPTAHPVATPVLAAPPPVAQVAAAPAPVAAPAPAPAPVDDPNVLFVTSPLVGTFYRSPSPNAPPFVEIGGSVRVGQRLCIVEAMKLMNEIESEVEGTLVEVLVENGKPVEYGQKLFKVKKG